MSPTWSIDKLRSIMAGGVGRHGLVYLLYSTNSLHWWLKYRPRVIVNILHQQRGTALYRYS